MPQGLRDSERVSNAREGGESRYKATTDRLLEVICVARLRTWRAWRSKSLQLQPQAAQRRTPAHQRAGR